MNKRADNMLDTLIRTLRCPHCAPRGKQGLLGVGEDNWLVCREPGCKRKYPVYDSLPIMLTEEGDFYHFRKGLEGADLRVHSQLGRKSGEEGFGAA